MKKDIAVRNIDADLWNWFVGYCKQKGQTTATCMEEIIKRLKKKH